MPYVHYGIVLKSIIKRKMAMNQSSLIQPNMLKLQHYFLH